MLWTVAKEAAGNWSSHNDSRQGAALAYYSVFSLGPIIVIAIAVAGFFFGSVTSLLFAMMFKWLPDAAVDWYDVWLGAVTTALLFELGKSAIGFYIGKQGLESTYGAAASIIVILIWVYYSSQIILMGAEVTHAFAKHKGSLRNCGPSARSADPLKDRSAINAS